MRKTFVVAIREYLAAVRTKSFLVSLIVLPIMMSGGLIAQKLGKKIGDTSTKHIALIDRTPGAQVAGALVHAAEQYNSKNIFNESGKQVRARFDMQRVEPAADVDRQHFELSERIRKEELLAYLDIDADALAPAAQVSASPTSQPASLVHYSTNRPTYLDFTQFLNEVLPRIIQAKRFEAAGMNYAQLAPLLSVPPVETMGLAGLENGKVTYESKNGQFASFIVPVVLIFLMFIVVLVGASPMTANVIEEKQLRIAEVLLGSVRPGELMMGKLVGGVGVALTLALIYFGGAYSVAVQQGMASYVTPAAICWFVFFTVLGVFMYGAMFVAAGAAVTNIKEAQTIIMPVMFLIVLPMSLLANLIQDPSGPLAMAASLFPFSAPMMMTARLTIPPGVPLWQPLVAAGLTILTTVALVWAAGRIFRVGLLMQGQGARVGEMLKWVIRG